jgi:cytochrome bd-type quinol oxidase subunit 1
VAIWAVAELHLLFAAFVLAVPIFAFISSDRLQDRRSAIRPARVRVHEAALTSFSLTATFGACLTFMLIILYPKFTNYLMSVFSPTFLPYVLLFFFEAFFLYTYYYGWGKVHPLVHIGPGARPQPRWHGHHDDRQCLGHVHDVAGGDLGPGGGALRLGRESTTTPWMPINIHRFIANIAFGGSVAGAYAAFKFLQAETDEERAHYDWMGYIGNFVAISAFLPLPFRGLLLAKEIYAFSQTLGLTMMGGAFSWLFIVQAV